jgi:hypothetical protein
MGLESGPSTIKLSLPHAALPQVPSRGQGEPIPGLELAFSSGQGEVQGQRFRDLFAQHSEDM